MSLWWLTPEGSRALAEENRELDERYEREMEFRQRAEPLTSEIDCLRALLREALESMLNLAPRVKGYDGCFGRMVGGTGGEDCTCTACKIKREIGDK